jgi:hypothetical protein
MSCCFTPCAEQDATVLADGSVRCGSGGNWRQLGAIVDEMNLVGRAADAPSGMVTIEGKLELDGGHDAGGSR